MNGFQVFNTRTLRVKLPKLLLRCYVGTEGKDKVSYLESEVRVKYTIIGYEEGDSETTDCDRVSLSDHNITECVQLPQVGV